MKPLALASLVALAASANAQEPDRYDLVHAPLRTIQRCALVQEHMAGLYPDNAAAHGNLAADFREIVSLITEQLPASKRGAVAESWAIMATPSREDALEKAAMNGRLKGGDWSFEDLSDRDLMLHERASGCNAIRLVYHLLVPPQ